MFSQKRVLTILLVFLIYIIFLSYITIHQFDEEIYDTEENRLLKRKVESLKKTNRLEKGLKRTERHRMIKKKNNTKQRNSYNQGYRKKSMRKDSRKSKVENSNYLPKGDRVEIKALSSRHEVTVMVDDTLIYKRDEGDRDFRGIHVLVLNQHKGHLMAFACFDTFIADKGHLVDFLRSIQNGRLVVFLIGYEGSWKLAADSKSIIQTYGSKSIWQLGFRYTWVFITKKGHFPFGEKNDELGNPNTVVRLIKLETAKDGCNWGDEMKWKKRNYFCSKYGGYGEFCNCTKPMSIDSVKSSVLHGSKVNDIPIAIMAENKPRHLIRMLIRLLSTPGVNRNIITVFINGLNDAPADLSALFRLNYVKKARLCSGSCGISLHYKRSLAHVFRKHKDARYVIIMQEDLRVSRDIMGYFSQLLPALESDNSIFCISAWNDQGFVHSSNDSSMLYRVETFPGLGLGTLIKRSLFIQELEPYWPQLGSRINGQTWLHSKQIRNDRDCIIPDVPRIFHFNLNLDLYELFFQKRALNNHTGTRFESMTKNNYDNRLHRLIKSSEILDHTKNPCELDFIPNTKNHSYVMYIQFSTERDHKTWLHLAKCFNMWWLDVRGHHKHVFRFWIKQNRLILVGSMSPYFMHKPKDIRALSIVKEHRHHIKKMILKKNIELKYETI